MKYISIFLISCTLFAQQAFTPIKIDGPIKFDLSQEQIIKVLEIQRAQYQALSEREKYHLAMLDAEKSMNAAVQQLQTYNEAMTNLRNDFRKDLKCPDCELQAPTTGFLRAMDIHFVRVLPQDVTTYDPKKP